MEKFCRDLETVLQKDHRDMREWGSKFIGLILRIAGLLHASCSEAEHIDQRMIENAIQIGVYAFAQAQYAYSVLGADETVEKAMHVVSRLRRGRISRISRSDLYQRCRGRYFRDVRELDPVLDLLECHGYIRIEATPYSGTGRPPTSLIYLNPLALEDD